MIEYDYIHDTTSHCSCLVVERVSMNFSDNPRINSKTKYIIYKLLFIELKRNLCNKNNIFSLHVVLF